MKDVTSTSFGLLIAFVLPGLAGFYSLVFWSPRVQRLFNTFLTARSNIGLVLLVFAGAILIGLHVALLRWLLYERLLCRSMRFDPADFAVLGTAENKLAAFRAVTEEHYRYHQFWGGMSIVMPMFILGWLVDLWAFLRWWQILLGLLGLVAMEVATACGAIAAYRKYVDRGKHILKGDSNAQRVGQEN